MKNIHDPYIANVTSFDDYHDMVLCTNLPRLLGITNLHRMTFLCIITLNRPFETSSRLSLQTI